MKKWIWALLPLSLTAQPADYWQQKVAYDMNVKLNDENHQLEGFQKLTYYNNSPDTLHKVYYHLYFNAFQPGSMMDLRSRNIADPDKRVGDRIGELEPHEQGYQQVRELTQDSRPASYELRETVLEVNLPRPIPPGDSSVFEMNFRSQVPVQIRRSGRDNEEGIDYTMTQWFPKMAAYDRDGWHPDPYVGREFYAPFGKWDVRIELPADYKVAGTGLLQNFEQYWERGESMEEGLYRYEYLPGEEDRRIWHFKADSVHDFAWAADPDYRHLALDRGTPVRMHFLFLEEYAETWEKLPLETKRIFEEMNKRFGEYPYPQFSVIQGGDGGMEYPMCTMLKGTGGIDGLKGVTAHEGGHNWFYGVLATNESQYPWMDEGFTSFAENEVLNALREEPEVNAHKRAYRHHNMLASRNALAPLSTPADYYEMNVQYSVNAYSRGRLFLSQLRYIMGVPAFDRSMLRYWDSWKFKHPRPLDFLRIAEEESGLELDWFYNFWVNTTQTIDYGFKEVESMRDGTRITLEKLGQMPMPQRLKVVTKSGGVEFYYIPITSMMGAPATEKNVLEPWPWTHPEYSLEIKPKFEDIAEMYLDPAGFTADTNRANNQYPREEGQE